METNQIHKKISNNWVKVLGLSQTLKGLLGEFAGNNAFGYVYIDHEAGLTLDIAKSFDLENDKLVNIKSPQGEGIRCIARFEHFTKSGKIELATPEEIKENDLKLLFPLEELNPRKDLTPFRQAEIYDPFRAPGFPDDVQILIPPKGKLSPELIWGRIERYDPETKRLNCNLLNQPSQKFGLRKGEEISAVPVEIEGKKYLMCELGEKQKSGEPPKKKRWKFW